LGKQFGLSAKLVAETDAKFVDLKSYWDKLRQLSPMSAVTLGLLPSSVRRTSTKIVYNPNESETKEINFHFSLSKFNFSFKRRPKASVF